jgi:hypothetical protein
MACDEWCRQDKCILRVAVGGKSDRSDMCYVDQATTPPSFQLKWLGLGLTTMGTWLLSIQRRLRWSVSRRNSLPRR